MKFGTKIGLFLALALLVVGFLAGHRWLFAIDAMEWGVLVDLDTDSPQADLATDPADPHASKLSAVLADSISWTSEPGIHGFPCGVREPVMYFRSKIPLSLSVHVGFPGGEPSVAYPQADRRQPGLEWQLELRPGSNAGFDSFPGVYAYMHDPSSTPLQVGQKTSSFLYYEGTLPRPRRLAVTPMTWGDSLVVTNPFPYPIHDACVKGRSRRGFVAASRCFDSLAAGQTVVVRGNRDMRLIERLRRQGMPEVQARAMDHFWGSQIDRADEGRTYVAWSYRIPQKKLDSILPVTFSRSNVRFQRWIYAYHISMDKITKRDTQRF